MWRNFTAYFNGYYNATKIYDETIESIKSKQKTLFTFNEVTPQSTEQKNLNKVIEKLSRILQFKQNSGLVDDALFLTGKAFFYQTNYLKASRKFTELIAKYPNSGLVLESQFWIVKSQFRLKNYNQALQILDEIFAATDPQKNKKIFEEAYMELATYNLIQENYEKAIENAEKIIRISDDEELKSKVAYEIGNFYLKLNDYEQAAKYYSDVSKYSPTYEIQYEANLAYGITQRKLNNNLQALELFKDIRSDKNNKDYADRTDLEIALTELNLKNYDAALTQFKYIDTAYKNTSSSGIAAYNVGKLMENHYRDFIKANEFYKKVMNSKAPKEILDTALSKTTTFSKYSNLTNNLNFYEKQLEYLEDSTAYTRDSIAYVAEQAKVDSLNKILKEEAAIASGQNETQNVSRRRGAPNNMDSRSNQVNTNVKLLKNEMRYPSKPRFSEDSIKTILAKNEYELGGLFFTEINDLDSAYYYYRHILNEYPYTRFIARTLYALGSYYLTIGEDQKADSLYKIVYNDYSYDNVANAAAEKLGLPLIEKDPDPAENAFLSAEEKYLEEKFKEAAQDYFNIYKQYPKSELAPKALFTSGWIYENKLEDIKSATSVYDSLMIKFPTTQYAQRIKAKMEIYKTYIDDQKIMNEDIKQENVTTPVPEENNKDRYIIDDEVPANQKKNEEKSGNVKKPER